MSTLLEIEVEKVKTLKPNVMTIQDKTRNFQDGDPMLRLFTAELEKLMILTQC